jgi:hypothetical protein
MPGRISCAITPPLKACSPRSNDTFYETYKDVLSKRESPKAQNAPREEKVLLVDFASGSQALVKVRVRIGATHFIDYLTYHLIEGEWLITSKAYHVDS